MLNLFISLLSAGKPARLGGESAGQSLLAPLVLAEESPGSIEQGAR